MVNGREEDRLTKACAKRKSSITRAAHKRPQSLGAALRQNETSNDQRMNQSSAWPLSSCNRDRLSQKRKRSEDMDEGGCTHASQRLCTAHPPVEIRGHDQRFARRPLFPDIREHEGAGEEFNPRRISSNSTYYVPGARSSVLAAPMLHRYDGQSTIATLDSSLPNTESRYSDRHHKMHKRSQSDVGGLYSFHGTNVFSATLPRHPASHYDAPPTRRSLSPPIIQPLSVTPTRGLSGHMRNRSTTGAHHLYQAQGAPPGGYGNFENTPRPDIWLMDPPASSFYSAQR
jgi:hypothetical protein